MGTGLGKSSGRTAWLALIPDLAAVVLFVAIGRDVHGHTDSLLGMFKTTWPFAVGTVIGFVPMYLLRMNYSISAGVVSVVATVAIGMILRVIVGQGTAVPFIFVSLGFLGMIQLGWRLIYRFMENRVEAKG